LEEWGSVLSLAILLGFADSKKNGWHVGWSAGGGETQQKISGCSTQPTNKPWPMLEPSPKNGIVEFWNDGFKENEIQSTSLIKIWHSISDCYR
jgi:hypothetical protein